MQERVISEEGKFIAEAAGMRVVMNLCVMKTIKSDNRGQFFKLIGYE
jgi:predicted CoA-binding protein